MRFAQPLHQHHSVRAVQAVLPPLSTDDRQVVRTLRPRGLSPPRRLYTHPARKHIAACSQSWGSLCFHGLTSAPLRKTDMQPFSHNAVHTLRRTPPIRSCTVSPRPFPSWRCLPYEHVMFPPPWRHKDAGLRTLQMWWPKSHAPKKEPSTLAPCRDHRS